jgi:5'(3')-deoxyribonucleotidase
MDTKLLLDLDGVLVDFTGGLSKFVNEPLDPFPFPGEFNFIELLDYSKDPDNKNLWNALDVNFWANLEWTEYGRDILEWIESNFCDQVYICTTATNNPTSYIGKQQWMEKHLPRYLWEGRLIFTQSKQALASPHTILVDDRDKSVDKFCCAGGYGVLVPAPWNREYRLTQHSWCLTSKRIRQAKYCIEGKGEIDNFV